MADIFIPDPTSMLNPRSASNPQSSPKPSSKNSSVTKSPYPRPTLYRPLSPEGMKPRHLSELAMPSPISTPGAEHLSDVSSCCSLDETDSNRSSPPDSPASSLTVNSFSIPAADLKRRYKKELWSAIRSDYRYLMDEEIIDTCRSTESDLSFESDDQTASITVVSFKDFMQHYNELKSWLSAMLKRAQNQCNCRSEKYVNQTYHEDMLGHLTSLKHLKDYAKQLSTAHPRLKDDICGHLKQLNGLWDQLERLLLPDANHSDQKKMIHDMEYDFDSLRQWVDDMEVKRRNWRLHSHWTNNDIDKHLGNQKILQSQIESHSRMINFLLSLCNRLETERDDPKSGSKVSVDDRGRARQLKEQVIEIQNELHIIWLNSIEWQMTLEDARKNGIHLRHNAEDDQWDRMRSTGQRRQIDELKTPHDLSSDLASDDSFFCDRPLLKKRSESGKGSEREADGRDGPPTELFTDVDTDDGGSSAGRYLQVPVDRNGRSYSDPLLNGGLSDGQFFDSPSGNCFDDRSNPRADVIPVDASGNRDNDPCREWSPPGQLRRCDAIDLMAAFCETKNDVPVDIGYSSGSHSNEETDSSARQELFIYPPTQNPPNRTNENFLRDVVVKENFMNLTVDHCKDAKLGNVSAGEASNASAKVFSDGADDCQLEAEEELNLPETEDEMSVELPLDDVPVVQSSDFRAEDNCGPLPKRSFVKSMMTSRRNLRFVEDSSTSDFDSWSQIKVGSPKKKPGIGRLEPDAKALLAGAEKRRKFRCLGSSTPLSGSCYASSEGTESESDFLNGGSNIEKCERKFGRHLKWNGSMSLRSSPVKEIVETRTGRSPLKRRMSESMENIHSDCRYGTDALRQWMSDSAITELLKEDSISPVKIPKMSPKVSDFLVSADDFRSVPKRSDGLAQRAENDGTGRERMKAVGNIMQKKILGEPKDHVLQRSLNDLPLFLGCEDDAVVPCYDSLSSSLTELTTDDCQMYNSDYEKIPEDEMQWHDEDFYGDVFSGDVKETGKGRYPACEFALPGCSGMDSDSDVEDFQYILNESRKGLKFIEATIRQDCGGRNGVSAQDPAAFNDPLATCRTSIVCLQELIDALKLKNKMDGEILQVTEIVAQWNHLQSSLLLLQKEAQQISEFQAEVSALQMQLENLNTVVEFDDRFRDIHQLEESVRAVKAAQFELNEKTDLRLRALDNTLRQLVHDRADLDPQLVALGEQTEHLKKYRDAFAKRCEVNERRLQSALISWHRFNNMEKEFVSLLQQCGQVAELSDSSAQACSEEAVDLEVTNWKMLDEKLQQLSSVYLDFASVCSDSSVLALKQAISLSSGRLQALRQTNDEKLMQLVKSSRSSLPCPETVGHQVAAGVNSQALSSGLVPGGNAARPVNYILPLALAFAFLSCLYALLGDGWYELLGTLGLMVDPNLRHTRGPPPS